MVNVSSFIKIRCLIQRPPFFISRDKLKRLVAQFGPYSWVDYDWRATSSLGRCVTMLGIMFVVSLTDRFLHNLPSVIYISVPYCFELMYIVCIFSECRAYLLRSCDRAS
jgi:hypothetical protein